MEELLIFVLNCVVGFVIGLFVAIWKNNYIWVPSKKLEDGTYQFGTIIKGLNGLVIGFIVVLCYLLGIVELVFPYLPEHTLTGTYINFWLPLLITVIVILTGVAAPDLIKKPEPSTSDEIDKEKLLNTILEQIKSAQTPQQTNKLLESLTKQVAAQEG